MAKRTPLKQQLAFLGALNTSLQNGFSIKDALIILKRFPKLAGISADVLARLDVGTGFAESIAEYFSPDIVHQMLIAESHGDLKQTLAEIEHFLRAQQRQLERLKGVLAYPALLMVLLVVMIAGVKGFVTPQLMALTDAKQPQGHWFLWGLLVVPVAGLLFFIWHAKRSFSPIKRANWLVRVPLVGPIMQSYYGCYLAHTVALMLTGGLEAKSIAAVLTDFKRDSLLNELGGALQNHLKSGGAIQPFLRSYRFIEPELMQLVDQGERIEAVSGKLQLYAQFAFERMGRQTQRLISTVQPVVFLLIGGMLVWTYLSMLLPMYDTLNGVGK